MPKIVLTWTDTSGDGKGLATDQLYGMVVSVQHKSAFPIPFGATRADETLDVPIPADQVSAAGYAVYGAWRREDGLDASDTMYLEIGM
jgi:hypothetical protein